MGVSSHLQQYGRTGCPTRRTGGCHNRLKAQPKTFVTSPPLPGRGTWRHCLSESALSPLDARLQPAVHAGTSRGPMMCVTPCVGDQGPCGSGHRCAHGVVAADGHNARGTRQPTACWLASVADVPQAATLPEDAAVGGSRHWPLLWRNSANVLPPQLSQHRMIEAAQVRRLCTSLTLRVPVGQGPPAKEAYQPCQAGLPDQRALNWRTIWTPCRAAARWELAGTCQFRSASSGEYASFRPSLP